MAKKKEAPKPTQNPFIITKVPDPSDVEQEGAATMSAARQTISRPGLKLGEHKELIELELRDIVARSSQTLGRIAHNKVTTAATNMARLELSKRRAEREAMKKKSQLIVKEEDMSDKEQLDESCTHEAYCKYHKRAGSALKDIAGHLDRHSYLTNKVVEKAEKKGYKSHVDHHGMKSIADQLEALQLQLAQDNEWKADMQKPVKAIKEEVEDLDEERKESGKVVDAFLAKKSIKGKRTHTDGKALYLHGNKIAWHGDKGEVYATMAGWGTKTTRDRLNTLANRLGKDSFSQKKGSQYHGKKAISNRAVVKLKEEVILEGAGDIATHLASGGSVGVVSAHKSGASKSENEAAHKKLGSRLHELGYESHEATETGKKKSIFHKAEKKKVHIVKGISKDHLKKVGNEFGQEHVLHGQGKEVHVHYLNAAAKHLHGKVGVIKSLKEEGGAGEEGTPELLKKYAEMTPGQSSVLKTLRKVVKEASEYSELQQKQKTETKTLEKKHIQQDVQTKKKSLDDQAKKKMEKVTE